MALSLAQQYDPHWTELYIHVEVVSEHHHQSQLSELSTSFTAKKEPTMISTKRIAQLAKKWQRMEALGRKRRLAWGTAAAAKKADRCCASVASKGHCAVYTTDGARFEVPLACLGTEVFAELLHMSREEFGFAGGHGRILLPCDAMVMEYALCLLRRGASADLEKAFLSTMAMSCHSADHAAAPYVAACC
ncbi:auxin-responsive protein SAUR36 [Zea mays]|uniref:Auxin-responsive protein SAUR36 n=2 Tax=Zea mays TaxID=4577 RepID=A0A804QBQ8_MAIZE|nr:auxin-responsive protein SAUR36 [Zea mays]|eukprot:XP_008653056.1 auxin-responsive protein SAUR36 [Zea mays]